MELGYSCGSDRGFDDAVARIESTAQAKGFRVLHIHDVKSTLEEKGFYREPFKIVEICNSKFAHRALAINEEVGLFMPCKINIYTKEGRTTISAMMPEMISEFFDNEELKQLAGEVGVIVRSIVDEAK
jgi:uncharacterized protein (DUF302 family)